MQADRSPLINRIKKHPVEAMAFSVVFAAAFLVSYALLYVTGFTPEPIAEDVNSSLGSALSGPSGEETDSTVSIESVPERIVIEALGVDAPVNNPQSRDIGVLDEALLTGVVHYPGSGDLEDHTNLFLFGHSSYLPVVRNQMFRVFNNLNKLKAGDLIRVRSDFYEYRYSVSSVELVNADEALVELSSREKKLTLSTCNSFGDPGERFVVEADFLGRTELQGSAL